jgi:DNA-binding GntR family transcriptional regulator
MDDAEVRRRHQDHAAILMAIQAGDQQEAQSLVARHMTQAMRLLKTHNRRSE